MWNLYDTTLNSRLILGTAGYPSPQILLESIEKSKCEVVTTSLRRTSQNGADNSFWALLQKSGVKILPNTAGCHGVKEAVTTAMMSREIFETNWIKLEIIGDQLTLQPDPFALVEATALLIKEGFNVFPYMTDDLILAQRLVDLGCEVLMPWAAPIGSGQGLINQHALKTLRERLPNTQLIIDAGIGRPSDATTAMELGYDGIMLNTAVAKATHPALMAKAFAQATDAGRAGYKAGIIPKHQFAQPSSPVIGTPFWHD